MSYLLTLLFCTTFTCEAPEVVRRSYPTEAAAVRALRAQGSAASPRLFRIAPQQDGTVQVRELTLGPAPSFTVRVSTYQAMVPQ